MSIPGTPDIVVIIYMIEKMTDQILNLHFTNYHNPVLSSISLGSAHSPQAKIFETIHPSWDYSTHAFAILVVLAARTNSDRSSEMITGVTNAPAGHLYREIDRPDSWINKLLIEWLDCQGKTPIITRKDENNASYLAILNPDLVSSKRIAITLDGWKITHPEELTRIAKAIERNVRKNTHQANATLEIPPAPPQTRSANELTVLKMLSSGPTVENSRRDRLSHCWKDNGAVNELKAITHKHLLIQKLYGLRIEILNPQGDARITVNTDIINGGRAAVSSRSQQYWFDSPQDDVEWEGRCETGEKLLIEELHASPTNRSIKISFPHELYPLERIKYSITYTVRNEFKVTDRNHFYHLFTRVITNLLSFEVIIPSGYCFSDTLLTHETADGFLRDDAPLISIAPAGDRQCLKWQINSPRPGDLFRTFWCYGLRDHRDNGLVSGRA